MQNRDIVADGVVQGSCLCGAVRYEVTNALRPVINCHCTQCRKWTGHFFAATATQTDHLTIVDPDHALRWYRTSDSARRGFCGRCGSGLFWRRDNTDTTSILAGTLDGDTGLKTDAEIYIKYKGDYYDLAHSNIPKYPETGHGIRVPDD